MQVKVGFVGLTRHYIGEKEKVFEVPEGSRVGDLLMLIGREYGARMPHQLWDGKNERFHSSIRATRRGSPASDDHERVKEGDEFFLISRMAGG